MPWFTTYQCHNPTDNRDVLLSALHIQRPVPLSRKWGPKTYLWLCPLKKEGNILTLSLQNEGVVVSLVTKTLDDEEQMEGAQSVITKGRG